MCVDEEDAKEKVQNIKYLGAIFGANETCGEDIELGATSKVIGKIR